MPDLAGQSPDVFPVYIKNITLYNRGGKLRIDLEFTLKQFFTSDTSVTTMIKNREALYNNLKLLIVATADKNLVQGAPATDTSAGTDGIFQDRSILERFITSNNGNSLVARGVYGIEEAMLGGTAHDSATSSVQAQQYGSIYGADLLFRKTFELPMKAPSYLSIFAAPFIVSTSATGNSNTGTIQTIALGKIASELVIKNSKVNLRTNMFYLKNGSGDDRIWTGDVHQDGINDWRTGNGEMGVNSGSPLRVKKVVNSKIVDQRNLARMERLSFNFNKLSALTTTNKSIRDRLKALEKIKKDHPSYISPLYFTKNENNNLSLYFGFDYLEAVVNNAKYEALYDSQLEKLSSCTVKSKRVIRRRVNKPNVFNRLTGGDSPLRLFDDRIEVIGDPGPAMDYNTSTGVRQYVIKDTKMKDITTGLYEYGFEITIEDNSRDKLLNILTDTNTASPGIDLLVGQLERFLTKSLLPGNYNLLTNQYTPSFVAKIKSGDAIETSATGLNPLIGAGNETITQEYSAALQSIVSRDSLARAYGGAQQTGQSLLGGPETVTIMHGSPWVLGVTKYGSALSFLFGPQDMQDLTNLSIATNPLITGPAGIQFLIKLLKDFSSSLRSAIGVTRGTAISTTNMAQAPSAPTTGGKKIFTIRQWFLNAVDADKLNDYGLDFLNLGPEPSGTGEVLKRIPFDSWERIIENQVGKDSGITVDGAVFLTPNFLRLPHKLPLNLYLDDEVTKNAIAEGFYEILYANMYRNSPIDLTPGSALAVNSALGQTSINVIQNQNALMHFNGCVASVFQHVPANPIMSIFATPETNQALADDYEKTLDSSVPLSTTSDFVVGPELEALTAGLLGSLSINLLQPGAGGSTSNLITQLVANVSQVSNYLVQGDFFNGKPNPTTPGMATWSGGSYFEGGMSVSEVQNEIDVANDIQLNMPAQPDLGAVTLSNPSAAPPPPPSAPEQDFTSQVSDESPFPDPANTALLAARYGFIYIVEYMEAYAIGGVGVMITEPVWRPLTNSVWASARDQTRSLVCRLKRHKTHLSDFNGLKMPVYNEVFVLGTGALLMLDEPTANPAIPSVTVSADVLGNINNFSDSIEFANSYDEEARIQYRPVPAMVDVVANVPDVREGSTQIALETMALVATTSTTTQQTPVVLGITTYDLGAGQAGGTYGNSSPSTPPPPPTPSGPTMSERKAIYRKFNTWYRQKLRRPGRPPRFLYGDGGPFQSWPLPIPRSHAWESGLRTIKMLWNGLGVPKRKDIIRQFENDKNLTVPTVGKRRSNSSY